MKKLIILSTIALFIYSCNSNKQEAVIEANVKSITVSTAKVLNLKENSKYTGKVASLNKTNLSTKVMGQIENIYFKEGDKVQKGDLILTINNKDLIAKKNQIKANIIEAKSAYENISKDYDRYKILLKQNSVSQKEFENIKTQFEITKAKLSALKEMQNEISELNKYSKIRAPYQGTIAKKFVNKGDIANPGTPLIAIESLNSYKVIAHIPESEIVNFKIGDWADINITALNKNNIKAKISQINSSNNFTGNTYEITLLIENDIQNLKSGMFAEVNFFKKDKGLILVPKESILTKGQLQFIRVLSSDNKVLLQLIKTGKIYKNFVEITSGLNNGEKFIPNANIKLKQGELVNPNELNIAYSK